MSLGMCVSRTAFWLVKVRNALPCDIEKFQEISATFSLT